MPTLLPMAPAALMLVQSEPTDPASGGDAADGPSGPQQFASWVLLAFGVAILIWVLLRLQWRRQRRAPEESPVYEMRETIADRQAEGQRAAEVAEIVRDLAARLETRAARLEALLDQADERIERLEARLAAGNAAEQMAAPKPAEPSAPPAPANGSVDPWDEAAGDPSPQRSATPPASDPLHEEVYELADDGRSPLDIARRLDQQVGTIELILALRRP